MRLEIFDVEHGACSLLTADNGTRLMIDCGHNGLTGWSPGQYLRQQGIDQLDMLAITNYDEDHASGAVDLFDNVFMAPGVTTGPEPVFEGLRREVFYNADPIFDDENNLSMALFLKCHGIGVMFTGDLESAGFKRLLESEAFRSALFQTNIDVASHHGRESVCCGCCSASGRRLLRCDLRQRLRLRHSADTTFLPADSQGRAIQK